jgi:hypothetical protein
MLLVLLVLLMPSMAVRVVGSFMRPEPSTHTVIFQPFAVISVVLPGDGSTLVAAAATRAAVKQRAEASACYWLGDVGWGDSGDGITVPSFVTCLLVCPIVERCCWGKCLAEMFGSPCR